MSSISVVITAYNESHNIENCIKSARRLSQDVFLVDTGSTDDTVKAAALLGCTIKHFPYHRYVEPSRAFAMQSSNGAWVFILDADERITQELAKEVKLVIKNTDKTHFYMPRKNIFAGLKWLQHGGWYPDPVLRLVKKSAFKKWPHAIHASPLIEGHSGRLKNPIKHYFHPDLEHMVKKTAIFEDIESELLYKAHRKVNTAMFFRKYFGELYRRLVKNAGYLDGMPGVIESMYQGYSKTITYLMLYEKYQRKSPPH